MGADAGAAVAFIVSWTLIGYARVLVWELPFFGWEFVIWRIVVSLPLPILAGSWRGSRFRRRNARRRGMKLVIDGLLWLMVAALGFIAAYAAACCSTMARATA